MKSPLLAILLILVIGVLAAVESRQAAKRDAATPPGEQELLKARKANEEAQAEYYQEQTRKLKQPSPLPTPTPAKSFSQNVAENPASVVGVIGTILAALIASIVGLVTLYFNNRNAIRSQRDTQFYEAMKRLGDKDSPTIRANAAGLLALMAQVEWRELSIGLNWPPVRSIKSKPYFTTALDQLYAGLLLENNLVGIDSIKDAISQLIEFSPYLVTQKLYDANLRIQREFSSLIAEFFVMRRYETPPDPKDRSDKHRAVWEHLQHSTTYNQWDLRGFVAQSHSFEQRFNSYQHAYRRLSSGDSGQLLAANQESLWVASNRLSANVSLYCTSLGSAPLMGAGEGAWFHHSFLVGGNTALDSADLRGVDFYGSNLTRLWLHKAVMENAGFSDAVLTGATMSLGNLRGAHLNRANLHGTDLSGANLSDAKFAGAQIDSRTKLEGTNWWKADYYLPATEGDVDTSLLEKLFERYDAGVPGDSNEVHASVRNFIEKRKEQKSGNLKP